VRKRIFAFGTGFPVVMSIAVPVTCVGWEVRHCQRLKHAAAVITSRATNSHSVRISRREPSYIQKVPRT
jgi:hypothetical protein